MAAREHARLVDAVGEMHGTAAVDQRLCEVLAKLVARGDLGTRRRGAAPRVAVVTGGAMGATVTYYGSGAPAPVGITGWATGVQLWLKANGDLDIKSNIVAGTWTCPMGVYDGNTLAVNVGQSELI